MKKWIVGPVIAVAWLGSLYLAYGLGGMAGMFMPDRVSTAARTAFAVMTLLPASSAGACADDPASCGFASSSACLPLPFNELHAPHRSCRCSRWSLPPLDRGTT